ncbi:MAG: hypothetical protein G01um101429_1002 [Parcubacteria group bacterium Gr01-1014_29]|nr:MAG: hypothetical protein G01um101429_1002 [Parcubacteria group bacterium Gr01-1014_29]
MDKSLPASLFQREEQKPLRNAEVLWYKKIEAPLMERAGLCVEGAS